MRFLLATILLTILLQSCNLATKTMKENGTNQDIQKTDSSNYKFTNELINETSPYLLQHAHNPVDWYPWGPKALEKATKENKLILISIGYSACHWCHVMERESFENEEVAKIMNQHFVCIKVDREERPDIDQVYMSAVQLMNQSGGWPLNCFALPNGKPIYGGTYFPNSQWIEILENIDKVFKEDSAKIYDYADKLTEGIRQLELFKLNTDSSKIDKIKLHEMVAKWKKSFDSKHGGPNRAPKFPIPNNYQFLLQYGFLTANKDIQDYVHLTLQKMAFGGIYDQIGGGFARYSTDLFWKVPHFEKMLYDNAQLVSLYSKAYQHRQLQLYKDVVYETISFVERELSSKEGAFFSALDADSEGEEGKYYVWKKDELEKILGDEYKIAKSYFNINQKGLWESGNYILLRTKTNAEVAKDFNINENQLTEIVTKIKNKLYIHRNKRIRPELDNKSLTSWNALMLTACLDAYKTFGEKHFLELALSNIKFLEKWQLQTDFRLNHSYKNGKSTINGYLEDYVFMVEAYISLYENTFEEKWLQKGKNLIDYCLKHFYDENTGMFYFTSDIDPPLIARKQEIHDNVIPSSNSGMAKALFSLGSYLDLKDYKTTSNQMLKNVYSDLPSYGSGYSNWGILALQQTFPFFEIAISGKDFRQKANDIQKEFLPNTLILASEKESGLALLKSKWIKGTTMIYVCQNNLCKLPVASTSEALEQIVYYE